jgi:hypothetical protein
MTDRKVREADGWTVAEVKAALCLDPTETMRVVCRIPDGMGQHYDYVIVGVQDRVTDVGEEVVDLILDDFS